jgi:hypothetical protein
MLLTVFLSLVAKLTSVYGDCYVGTQEVNNFDFTKVGICVLIWFLNQVLFKQAAWICISFVDQYSNQTEYFRVIDWFIDNYLLVI